MADVWHRLKQLEGTELRTLARGRPFRIEAVKSDRVEFVPNNGKGTIRWCTRDAIEQMAHLKVPAEELRSRIQEEWPNDQNTSYIAAIVEAVR